MEISNSTVDNTGETAAESQGSDKSVGFENVKSFIADKLHAVAGVLNEKAAEPGRSIRHKLHTESRHPSGWTNQPSTFGNSTMSRQMPGFENTSGRAQDAAS